MLDVTYTGMESLGRISPPHSRLFSETHAVTRRSAELRVKLQRSVRFVIQLHAMVGNLSNSSVVGKSKKIEVLGRDIERLFSPPNRKRLKKGTGSTYVEIDNDWSKSFGLGAWSGVDDTVGWNSSLMPAKVRLRRRLSHDIRTVTQSSRDREQSNEIAVS